MFTDEEAIEIVNQAFSYLEQNFSNHNIFFVRECQDIDFFDHDLYYAMDPEFVTCNSVFPSPDVIDIVLLLDQSTYNEGSAITIPSTKFYLAGNFFNDPFDLLATTRAVSHEMGHCLGLYHTHGQVGLSIGLVNESDCATTGDLVCDTPPDPNMWYNVSLDSCLWTEAGTVQDSNEMYYMPDTKNIMAYTHVECMEYFTPGQGERMRQTIASTPALQACLVNEPEFFNDVVISQNTTWTTANTPNGGDFSIDGKLVIDCNAVLEIEGGVTVRFQNEGSVVITQGAELRLRGNLTGLSSTSAWEGVEVWGSSFESQYVVNGVRAQGKFVGYPGSLVENAKIGVRNYGPSYGLNAGGVISCNGVTFKNNRLAVEIAPYRNFWPYSFPPGQYDQPRSYFGSFTSCNFENNNSYNLPEPFYAFMDLRGVFGIRIRACDFNNSQMPLVSNDVADHGYGIFAVDAGFKVEAACAGNTAPCNNYINSSFSGLGYGIMTTAAVNNRPFTVKQTDFSDCFFGLKSNAVSNGTILFNDFNLGNVPNSSLNSGEQIGVFFESDISGFTMQENDFSGVSGNAVTTVGSFCQNMGHFNNLIRKNRYSNLNFGNVAEGENATGELSNSERGLHYLCNTNFSVDLADFAVASSSTVDRIRKSQGMENEGQQGNITYDAAGNRFSYGQGYDLLNEGEEFRYYYFPTGINETPLAIEGEIILNEAPENSCPEDYCEPPCKTNPEVLAEKEKYYDDRTKKMIALEEKELAESENNIVLAEEKEKEASYYQQKMDKEAYMVIIHLMHDTIFFDPDTLSTWIGNLDVFGMDMIWALNQQTSGNAQMAEQFIQRSAERIDLSEGQRDDLQGMENLLRMLDGHNPYNLEKEVLRQLEHFSDKELSLTGTVARNILTAHGYKFAPRYRLPSAKNRNDIDESLVDNNPKSNFSLFPNPNEGSFNLLWKPNTKSYEKAEIILRDLSGRVVFSQTVYGFESTEVQLTGEAKGVYFYQFIVEGQKPYVGKLIVQ